MTPRQIAACDLGMLDRIQRRVRNRNGLTELQIAEQIARTAHAGQKEQSTGEDYAGGHLQRVVDLLTTDQEKATGWLHDVLEDTEVTVSDMILQGISYEVVMAAILLTRAKSSGETYREYIDRLNASGNELAITVKKADLRDHLRPNNICPARLLPRYLAACEVFGLNEFLKGGHETEQTDNNT